MKKTLFFSTTNSSHLAVKVRKLAKLTQAKYRLGRFADGEILFYLDEEVSNKVCVVLGSTNSPAENFLEMLTIINTLKLNHAQKIIAVIPYLGYSRSDRVKPLQPINAKLFIKFLEQAGVDKFITMNLHSPLVEKYFTKPNLHLSFMSTFADEISKLHLKDFSTGTPDLGGTDRALEFAYHLKLSDIVVVEKHRPTDDATEVTKITGDIKGKTIVLVDDMIQTGHTLVNAAIALKKKGAGDIYACATHCVYQAEGIKLLIRASLFKHIFITNTISNNIKLPSYVSILDSSPQIALGIENTL